MLLVGEPFVATPLLVCQPTAVVPPPLRAKAVKAPITLAGEAATNAYRLKVDTAVTAVQSAAQEVWRLAQVRLTGRTVDTRSLSLILNTGSDTEAEQ